MDRVHVVWIFLIPADCLFVFLFVFRTVILCFIPLFLGGGGGGVSGRWWGGEPRSPVKWFSPGGLPEWGHHSKLGLGLGCSGPSHVQ